MVETVRQDRGRLLARTLVGAWRCTPPVVDFSTAELERIGPHLLRSGAGPLGWWRVSHSPLETSAVVTELRQAYRLNTLNSHLNESKIQRVFTLLRSVAVEPILIKGWAIARQYPEPGLRPCGDIDLCVPPGQYEVAASVLSSLDRREYRVDLHRGFEKLGQESFAELYSRSRLEKTGGVDVRVPSPEDHFRLICFHLLREGAWRPLWLCDVGALLEARSANFDWNICLGRKRRAEAVCCAIRLAHLLLGANIEDIPGAAIGKQLPRWLLPIVLKEWGSLIPSMKGRHNQTMLMHLRERTNLLAAIRHRWPNPIEATASMNGPFNELPRLPFQLGNCLSRTATFLMHLPKR